MRPPSGYAAYGKALKIVPRPRRVEGEALLKAAHLLDRAAREPGRLAQALEFNFKLWTVFRADLSSPESALPPSLRTNLLDLCAYMDAEIAVAARDPRRANLAPMIAVNRTLAQGLL